MVEMSESWAESSEDVVPVESDEVWSRRVASRQRQINIGKNRPEYKRYVQQVSTTDRTRDQPQTPDFTARISKRQFDRGLGNWRRQLHEFDAETKRVGGDGGGQSPVFCPVRSRKGCSHKGQLIEPVVTNTKDETLTHKQALDALNPERWGVLEVVKLKLAEQLPLVDHAVDGLWPDWHVPNKDPSGWGELDYGWSPDTRSSPWKRVEEPTFQTPPHGRTSAKDWTPVNPPLLTSSNLTAALSAEFVGDSCASLEQKTDLDWVPEMSSAEFAMMLQCCQEWSHPPQVLPEVQAPDALWRTEHSHRDVFLPKDSTFELDVKEQVCSGLECPSTPKSICASVCESPERRLLSNVNNQQASLPATPQPRCWVQSTPSPGPRTSVHWRPLPQDLPPLPQVLAPLPPLVMQPWD